MGITKLMHMKENPQCAHAHLRNAINYILDVKNNERKTMGGLWVGGNAGTGHREILNNFLETKRMYGKTDGRQGYHFVISFAKGEVDEKKAYDIVKDFCREYLGDDYDFVFAIHNDTEHMHGHIIFNSVRRPDGLKYHYRDGDWKKFVQPVTDRVCKKHGVAPLAFNDERVGESYAAHMAKKNNRLNMTDIIRADVDYAIRQSEDSSGFVQNMRRMGYRIGTGYSRKAQCGYYSLLAPGAERPRRSHRIGKGYSMEDIDMRIKTKSGSRHYEYVAEKISVIASEYLKPAVMERSKSFRRLYQTVNYYRLPNPYAVPAYRVRRDMLEIDRLISICRYLKENNLHSTGEIIKRRKEIEMQITQIKAERQTMYGIERMEKNMSAGQKEILNRCRKICADMKNAETEKQWEDMEDELVRLGRSLPEGMIENKEKIKNASAVLRQLGKEEKLLRQAAEQEREIRAERELKATKKKVPVSGTH